MTVYKQIDFDTTSDFSIQGESLSTYIQGSKFAKTYTLDSLTTITNSGTLDYAVEFVFEATTTNKFPNVGIGVSNKFWIDCWDDGGAYMQLSKNGPVSVVYTGYSNTYSISNGVHTAKILFDKPDLYRQPIKVRLFIDDIEVTYADGVAPSFLDVGAADSMQINMDGIVKSLKIYSNIITFWTNERGCTQS